MSFILRLWKYVAVGVGALVLGVFAGVATQGQHTSAANQTIASLKSQMSAMKGDLSSANQAAAQARRNAAGAENRAGHAIALANRAAAAKYAGKMAAANALLTKLHKEQQVTQQNTISQDGVYVIGQDIAPGMYHTSGGGQCYYATLNSTNTSDISDNNNFTGSETVSLNGVYAFQISGGCTWTKIG